MVRRCATQNEPPPLKNGPSQVRIRFKKKRGIRVYLQKECTCTLRIEKREKSHCYGNKVCMKKSQSRWCLLLNLQIVKANLLTNLMIASPSSLLSPSRDTSNQRYHSESSGWCISWRSAAVLIHSAVGVVCSSIFMKEALFSRFHHSSRQNRLLK